MAVNMDFSVWPINVIYPPRNKVLSSQGVKENLEPIDYLFREEDQAREKEFCLEQNKSTTTTKNTIHW